MNKILSKTNEFTTKFLANVLLFCAGLFVIALILNQMEVFLLNKSIFAIVSVMCSLILCIPKLLLIICGKYEEWLKYVLIACVITAINIAYTALTYHMTMALTLPLIISVMYFDSKITIFTTVFSVSAMSVSHIVSYYISSMYTISDIYADPLKTMNDILIFGLIPHILIYCAFALMCLVLGNITQKMLGKLHAQTAEIERNKNALDKIIEVSRPLYEAKNMVELAGLTRCAVLAVTEEFQKNDLKPIIFIGFKGQNGEYCCLDNNLDVSALDTDNGEIKIALGNKSFLYPVMRQKVWSDIQIYENHIGMTFYEKEELLFSISMEICIDTEDVLLNNTLDILYNNIKTAVCQTKMNNDIFNTQEAIILSFAEISESKSLQTGQHVKRVSEYVKVMAEYAGYDENERSKIALASMMHDVGKLMIPPEILEKPARLTPDEFNVIKTHVTYGEELLHNTRGEVMDMARRIALQHHERWDGHGYLGYIGEDIDVLSRLVAVADVFDALVSKRSYKEGWAPEEAYAEIIKQKGTQFSPYAVDIFIKSYDRILEILEQYPDQVMQSCTKN